MPDEIEDYIRYSPFLATVFEKDDDERWILCFKFSRLSDDGRELLTSPETADMIKSWELSGLMPATHSFAVAKIIGLTALGDIPIEELSGLLVKIGMPENNAADLAGKIRSFLEPITTERAKLELPADMSETEMPPMTRPMENGPKPLTPSVPRAKVPDRNIIDLRNKAE